MKMLVNVTITGFATQLVGEKKTKNILTGSAVGGLTVK
jgi:hypothetical protein